MKLKTTIKILFLTLFALPFLVTAQEDTPGEPNQLDELFIPDGNSVFNSDNETYNEDYDEASNFIRFNLALLPRSIAALTYERRIGDQVSLIAGLGTCFNKDHIIMNNENTFNEFASSSSSSNNEVLPLGRILSMGEFNEKSMYAEASLRFNFDPYYSWTDEPYFEINYRHYSNNLIIKSLDEDYYYGEYLDAPAEVNVKYNVITLINGTQVVTDGGLQTSHDFYYGVGMRMTSYDDFESDAVEDPLNYSQTTIAISPTGERNKENSFCFILGYILGFGF